jgi:hypothetical protein
MKKLMLIIFALVVTFAMAADETVISETSQHKLVLQKQFEADSLAHFDSLAIIGADGQKLEVFASEGREIEKVFEPDLDGDGINEILVQMDLGGSGGFREFALLKKQNESFATIWEETGFAGAETTVSKDEKTGESRIIIKFFDDNFEPAKPAMAVFGWQGKEVKRLR